MLQLDFGSPACALARNGVRVSQSRLVAQRRPIGATLPENARSVEVAACRGFLGEGIIVPIQFTSTAIISCVFASRVWCALLASFQWPA